MHFSKNQVYFKNKRKDDGKSLLYLSGFIRLLWKQFKIFPFTSLHSHFYFQAYPPKLKSNKLRLNVHTEQIPVLLRSVLRGEYSRLRRISSIM